MNDEQIIEYAQEKFGNQPQSETQEAGIATEASTEANVENQATTEQSTEIADNTEVNSQANNESSAEAPDYGKFLSETSEGLIGDVDSFKSFLPKIKEYDELVSSKAELEEKLKVDPFANDYVKTLNELVKAGKSADEIENFHKVSRMDIDQLSPKEAKVMVMVKNGYSEDIARQKVEKDYPIEEYEEGSSDRLILEEELRVSAIADKNVLKEYKKELTAIDTSANDKAEQDRLQNIANQAAHKEAVKKVVPSIAEKLTGLGEKNLNGKDGDEAIKLNFDYTDDYKKGLNDKLENFFVESGLPVNEDNISLAEKYVRAEYLESNIDSIIQMACKHTEAIITEKVTNRYENRSGLPSEAVNENVDNTSKEYNEFLDRLVGGR